jgi:hypothetical protein
MSRFIGINSWIYLHNIAKLQDHTIIYYNFLIHFQILVIVCPQIDLPPPIDLGGEALLPS